MSSFLFDKFKEQIFHDVTKLGDPSRVFMAADEPSRKLTVEDIERARKQMEDQYDMQRRVYTSTGYPKTSQSFPNVNINRSMPQYPNSMIPAEAMEACLLIAMAISDTRSGFAVPLEVLNELAQLAKQRGGLVEIRQDFRSDVISVVPNGQAMTWVQDEIKKRSPNFYRPPRIEFNDMIYKEEDEAPEPEEPKIKTTGQRQRSQAAKKLRKRRES